LDAALGKRDPAFVPLVFLVCETFIKVLSTLALPLALISGVKNYFSEGDRA
jgi:hypothetical protein